MEHIVKFIAPRHSGDFLLKLIFLLLLCGLLNHIRDVASYGLAGARSYIHNLNDATWTALPMCTLGLLLIKHLNNLQKRLYEQTVTDTLTSLPNRRWFFKRCSHGIQNGAGLVLFDVDHFKRINDTYGHDVGDQCLKAIAALFVDSLPQGTRCARLGGEEFGILFDRMNESALEHVRSICTGTALTTTDQNKVQLTLSAGVYRAHSKTCLQDAFRLADAALYRAKSSGRAQFAMAVPETELLQSYHAAVARASIG